MMYSLSLFFACELVLEFNAFLHELALIALVHVAWRFYAHRSH